MEDGVLALDVLSSVVIAGPSDDLTRGRRVLDESHPEVRTIPCALLIRIGAICYIAPRGGHSNETLVGSTRRARGICAPVRLYSGAPAGLARYPSGRRESDP